MWLSPDGKDATTHFLLLLEINEEQKGLQNPNLDF